MSVLLAIAAFAYVGEIALDLWLTRRWKRIRRDAQACIDEAREWNARNDRLAQRQRDMLSAMIGWNEMFHERELWITMTADEKERHLASVRALWAATQAAMEDAP